MNIESASAASIEMYLPRSIAAAISTPCASNLVKRPLRCDLSRDNNRSEWIIRIKNNFVSEGDLIMFIFLLRCGYNVALQVYGGSCVRSAEIMASKPCRETARPEERHPNPPVALFRRRS